MSKSQFTIRLLAFLTGTTCIQLLGDDFSFMEIPVNKALAIDLNGNSKIDLKENDGLLAIDLDQDKAINLKLELFHSTSRRIKVDPKKPTNFSDGFAALRQYDLNGDNKIDKKDAIYHQLIIWKDANQNRISETKELTSVAHAAIKVIHLPTVAEDKDAKNSAKQESNAETKKGKKLMIGSTRFSIAGA